MDIDAQVSDTKSRAAATDANPVATTKETPQKTGFTRPDGSKRRFNAPAPPKRVDWSPIHNSLVSWAAHRTRTFDADSDDPFVFVGRETIAVDIPKLTDTSKAINNAFFIVRPYVLGTIEETTPWRDSVVDELARVGTHLASSFMFNVEYKYHGMKEALFGVLSFHLSFRFFLFVIFGGETIDVGRNIVVEKKGERFQSADGCYVVGYYILCHSFEDAVKNQMV